MKSLFLDTNALNALSGLKDKTLLSSIVNYLNKGLAEFCISHIQIDEKYTWNVKDYSAKISRALTKLSAKGLKIGKMEPTKAAIIATSRIGMSKIPKEIVGKIRKEIVKELRIREGRNNGNIARDSLIACTSLGYDYFITCDRNLEDVSKKVFSNYRDELNKENIKIPGIYLTSPYPNDVASCILGLVKTI